MKLNLLFTSIFSLLCYFLTAQITFTKIFGGTNTDYGSSVQPTIEGGYIIVGYTASYGAGQGDIYLIKTNSIGIQTWYKTLGDSNVQEGYSIVKSDDGGFVITGSYGGVYILKTNGNGDSLWSKKIGGTNDVGRSIAKTTDGGYVVTGYKKVGTYGDVYMIKIDASGNTLWIKTFGGQKLDSGREVQQTSDGGYIIVGSAASFSVGGDADVYLIKTDSNGDSLWTKIFGGTGSDYGYSVQQTTDGGYIIAGYSNSFGTGISDYDSYVIRTDSNGDSLWTKTYGGTNSDQSFSVQQTPDGGYIIAGSAEVLGTNDDSYLIKTNSTGDTLWTKRFTGSYFDQIGEIQLTNDGGFVCVGNKTIGGGSDSQVSLIKTDCKGNITSWDSVSCPILTTDISQPIANNISTFSIYPNPNNGKFLLQGAMSDGLETNFTIFNILGEIIYQTEIPGLQFEFDLSSQPQGIYFMRINEGEKVFFEKILLQ